MPGKSTDIKEGASKFFESLPWFIKLAIIATVIIIIFVLVRRAYRAIVIPMRTKDEALAANQEMNALQEIGEAASYPPSKYDELATALYNSMDGWGTWDDDLDAVFNQLHNNMDFLLLKQAFGLREGYTFQEWLDGDLSDDRKSEINQVLRSKGIKYQI